MSKTLTKRQLAIYEYIAAQIRQRGFPPTLREIGDRFGMRSSNGAREVLGALVSKGYLARKERLSRGIELVSPVDGVAPPAEPVRVPVLRSWGDSIQRIEDAPHERVLFVDSSFFPPRERLFAAVAPDSSLAKHGVRRGDIVVATECGEGQPGDILVTAIESRLALARVPTTLDIDPAQPSHDDQPPARVRGKVIFIMRRLTNLGAAEPQQTPVPS